MPAWLVIVGHICDTTPCVYSAGVVLARPMAMGHAELNHPSSLVRHGTARNKRKSCHVRGSAASLTRPSRKSGRTCPDDSAKLQCFRPRIVLSLFGHAHLGRAPPRPKTMYVCVRIRIFVYVQGRPQTQTYKCLHKCIL